MYMGLTSMCEFNMWALIHVKVVVLKARRIFSCERVDVCV